jgi:hypothetical protein
MKQHVSKKSGNIVMLYSISMNFENHVEATQREVIPGSALSSDTTKNVIKCCWLGLGMCSTRGSHKISVECALLAQCCACQVC